MNKKLLEKTKNKNYRMYKYMQYCDISSLAMNKR